jgi:hypothetical protein
LPEKLAGGGGCGANSNYDSKKRLGFVLLFLVVLRGVRFPPHREGPRFESRPGTLGEILQ